MSDLSESALEQATQGWFQELGYETLHGPEIAHDEPGAERESYNEVVLIGRLRDAIDRLNPDIPAAVREDALKQVLRPASPSLIVNNQAFHAMLRDGVEVEYSRPDGSVKGDRVRLLSDTPAENDYLAVDQFTVTEGQHTRRPDIVVFVNGLPVAVLELKAALDEGATIWSAWNQLQTYKSQLPMLFAYNELLVISDGLNARIGSLTAGKEWFKSWRTIDGSDPLEGMIELEMLVRGVFGKSRLTTLLKHYIVFEHDTDSDEVYKIFAQYHQFHAVEKAVGETVAASAATGDQRCGVVWHTQGSGKSLSMLFYAGRVIREAAMKNPTLVVLTDRNDLDDQLFGQFARCSQLLRQQPQQSTSRGQLQKLLSVASGVWYLQRSRSFSGAQRDGLSDTLGAAEHCGHCRRGPS